VKTERVNPLMPAKHENIEELLEIAYESDSPEEISKIAKIILGHNPNHPEALFLLADTLEDDEEQLILLRRAYKIAKKDFYEEFDEGEEGEALDSDSGIVYSGIIQRMIIPLADKEKIEDAFVLAQELRKLDPENQIQSHALFYYMLLKKKDFSCILEETMKDSIHSLAWAWARFIAVFELSGECNSTEKYFWEAIQMGPDVPFYMFGKYEEPNDDSEEDDEDFTFALLFSEHISCISIELAAYVMSRVNIFGLLSNRITNEDTEEYGSAMEILRSSGLMDNYLTLLDELENKDYPDESIIRIICRNFSC
jgi:tetratricopeptide (TPR) repeat protein